MEQMIDLKEGTYRGSPLELEPINTTLESAAQRFKLGRAVYIELEPGDMTRYSFALVPWWGEEMRPTRYSVTDSLRHAELAYYNQGVCGEFPTDRGPETILFELREFIKNEWTAQVLAAFLNRLVQAAR